MKILRVPIHIVFYLEEGDWVAHCLEFDICGNGETKREAAESLVQAVKIQIEQSLNHNNPANLFCPAEGKYFEMFAAGKNITNAELEMHFDPIDSVNLEEPQSREYSEGDLVMA
ncbi:MAG: hypothetical protein EXS05_17085 [Planctomycetaceae bacterium]|nr:hypothetical protein [Planctomycetaceae bacterium]